MAWTEGNLQRLRATIESLQRAGQTRQRGRESVTQALQFAGTTIPASIRALTSQMFSAKEREAGEAF
ncbi:unnamed protein product, partial [marine sediment metagenome]